jgi:hypothetical protein
MGIDYGRGLTNIDHANGIRYGVLPMHEVCQAWSDSSEPQYGEPEREDCNCPECGHNDDGTYSWGESLICEECGAEYEIEFPDCAEPLGFEYVDSDYTANQSDSDIFILQSPYYTKCGFCSPCAPGAGYLLTQSDDCKAYCFGHDWFDNGRAPYEVYRVSDNSIVEPTVE